MAVDVPLSYGQLYSWREIATYPPDWMREANLSTIWNLRGIAPDRVAAALQRLVDRYEALRTTYHLRSSEPLQRIQLAAAPPIEHVNRVITSHDDWKRTADELAEVAGAPFPMTGNVGWRGVLASSGGAPMLLALSFSHLILDIWSVQNLQTQFQQLITDPDSAAPHAPTPRELTHQRPPYDGGERYWKRILDDDPLRSLPTLPAGAKRHRIQATLHSPRLAWLVDQAGKRLGVTAPSVLMALFAAGLSQHLDTDRITMSLMASNRYTPALRHVVSTMNQLIPVIATVDHRSPLAQHVTRQHWAAARAYRYSSYDIDHIAALAAATHPDAGHDCWFNHLFRCWFNYIQFDNQPTDPQAQTPAKLVWTPLARQYGQPIDIRITARRGSISLALRADPTIISADALTGILRAVALGVQLAASEPHTSLKEIWNGNLPPSVFPPEIPAPPN